MTHASCFWQRFRGHLHERRFWTVQVLVLAFATAHTTLESTGTFAEVGDLYMLPVSLFIIPFLYASLTFGLEGALSTGLWCALLTVPPIIHFHDGRERIGSFLQLAFLLLLGTIVAIRVDQERHARLAAQNANRQLADIQAAQKRFIGLALRAEEEERFRISRELHDETVQELLVAKTALEAVLVPSSQHAQLELVDATLQRSIDGIRRLCRALRPSVLDDLGLMPALDWLLSDLAGRTGISTTLQAVGDCPALSPEQEMVIFRVAQEALHNVNQHAQASQVVIHLACSPGRVCVEVLDDGCGFDISHPRQGSLGLAGMHERASLIGAQLDISSRPGATRVLLDLRPASSSTAAA